MANADSIQRAITVANDNDTIALQAGTYVGGAFVDTTNGVTVGIYIDKPLTLVGPNTTFDPLTDTTPANAQAIIRTGGFQSRSEIVPTMSSSLKSCWQQCYHSGADSRWQQQFFRLHA